MKFRTATLSSVVTASTAVAALSSAKTTTTTTNDLDGMPFLQQPDQRQSSIHGSAGRPGRRRRLSQQRYRLEQKFWKQNNDQPSEERGRRLVNVNADLDGRRRDDHSHGHAADVGILSAGGTATYGAESVLRADPDDGSSSRLPSDDKQHGLRQLQENLVIGPDTPVKNSNFTLGDFRLYALSYIYIDDDLCFSDFCACVNNTDGTTTIACQYYERYCIGPLPGNCEYLEEYCDDYTSRCGQKSTQCFEETGQATLADNSNFFTTRCRDFSVPYEQSYCFTGVTEDNFVTSCSATWNGVECQKCQVEPTVVIWSSPAYGGGDRITWCYLLDCTNTDLGVEFNDCYWSADFNPMYNNVHVSAGCEESCQICPEGGRDGTATIETFAANGTFSCADIFDLGSNGYFSVDECAAVQSSLPNECGCSGLSVGEDSSTAGDGTDLSTGDVSNSSAGNGTDSSISDGSGSSADDGTDSWVSDGSSSSAGDGTDSSVGDTSEADGTGLSVGDGSDKVSPSEPESATEPPEGAAPSGSKPLNQESTLSLVLRCAMMAGAIIVFGTEIYPFVTI